MSWSQDLQVLAPIDQKTLGSEDLPDLVNGIGE